MDAACRDHGHKGTCQRNEVEVLYDGTARIFGVTPQVLIFGILVSTLLTLVVIPVLYYALFRKRMEARAG